MRRLGFAMVPSDVVAAIARTAAVVLAVTVTASAVATAEPASAAKVSGWTYSVARDAQWRPDTVSPAEHLLADRDAVAWTYGPVGPSQPLPDVPADFASLCPRSARSVPRVEDVRVAVVIDDHLDARSSRESASVSCLTLPPGLTSADALNRAALSVRRAGLLVCAINDIPATGCLDSPDAVVTATGSTDATNSGSPTGSPTFPDAGGLTATPATSGLPPGLPSESPSGQQLAAHARGTLMDTPRAWLLAGGLLLLGIGLAAARKRSTAKAS